MKKRKALLFILVCLLCLAILMPFYAKSIFAGHHCQGEGCKICEFIRLCDTLRDNMKPITDPILHFFSDLGIGKRITGIGMANPVTLTSLHVRLND